MVLRTRIQRIMEKVSRGWEPPNESTAIAQVIRPILKELGWDVDGESDVESVAYERPVGGKKGGGKADIVLLDARNRSVCLVEAKRAREELDEHVEQLINYTVHEAANICVLTNGFRWWFYLPKDEGEVGERRFAELDLKKDGLRELCRDFERYLSREALLSGQARDAAREAIKHRRKAADIQQTLPELWDRMTGPEPDRALVDLVRKRLRDEHDLHASAKQVADVIARKQVPATKSTVRSDDAKPSSSKRSEAAKKAHKPRAKSTKPVALDVLGVRCDIGTWREVLVEVVNVLYSRHSPSFLQVAEEALVGSRGRSRKHPLFSLDPKAYGAPFRVGESGYYMDAWKSSANIQRYVELLLEAFGYARSDYKVEFAD